MGMVALLPLAGILGMAMNSGWVGVMFGFAVQLARGLSMTLFYEALNSRVSGDFRATVNSLVSLVVRGVFIATGPLLGLALDRYGVNAVLLGLLVVFTPLSGLILVPLSGRIRSERAARNPELAAAG